MSASKFTSDVADEIARGAAAPDYFSTLPTKELQQTLRDAATLPLESLLNTSDVRVDFEQRRIRRDVFWKGSFARDSLLGLEPREPVRSFTGGSFWKRFDCVTDGVVEGYVVNYELSALPGLPHVRSVEYPDDRRRYFGKGDPILLLTYTNHPYQLVYDTIKVLDAENAIGVMHLGTFPTGVEVATFVLARHNYPFAYLSVPDHDLLWDHARAAAPSAESLAGSQWEGRLVHLRTPETNLSQSSPALFQAEFQASQVHLKAGPIAVKRDFDPSEWRLVGNDTLLGRWLADSHAPGAWRGTAGTLRFVLERSGA